MRQQKHHCGVACCTCLYRHSSCCQTVAQLHEQRVTWMPASSWSCVGCSRLPGYSLSGQQASWQLWHLLCLGQTLGPTTGPILLPQRCGVRFAPDPALLQHQVAQKGPAAPHCPTESGIVQARRQETQAAMEHQFRESMAGPEWELEDYEW